MASNAPRSPTHQPSGIARWGLPEPPRSSVGLATSIREKLRAFQNAPQDAPAPKPPQAAAPKVKIPAGQPLAASRAPLSDVYQRPRSSGGSDGGAVPRKSGESVASRDSGSGRSASGSRGGRDVPVGRRSSSESSASNDSTREKSNQATSGAVAALLRAGLEPKPAVAPVHRPVPPPPASATAPSVPFRGPLQLAPAGPAPQSVPVRGPLHAPAPAPAAKPQAAVPAPAHVPAPPAAQKPQPPTSDFAAAQRAQPPAPAPAPARAPMSAPVPKPQPPAPAAAPAPVLASAPAPTPPPPPQRRVPPPPPPPPPPPASYSSPGRPSSAEEQPTPQPAGRKLPRPSLAALSQERPVSGRKKMFENTSAAAAAAGIGAGRTPRENGPRLVFGPRSESAEPHATPAAAERQAGGTRAPASSPAGPAPRRRATEVKRKGPRESASLQALEEDHVENLAGRFGGSVKRRARKSMGPGQLALGPSLDESPEQRTARGKKSALTVGYMPTIAASADPTPSSSLANFKPSEILASGGLSGTGGLLQAAAARLALAEGAAGTARRLSGALAEAGAPQRERESTGSVVVRASAASGLGLLGIPEDPASRRASGFDPDDEEEEAGGAPDFASPPRATDLSAINPMSTPGTMRLSSLAVLAAAPSPHAAPRRSDAVAPIASYRPFAPLESPSPALDRRQRNLARLSSGLRVDDSPQWAVESPGAAGRWSASRRSSSADPTPRRSSAARRELEYMRSPSCASEGEPLGSDASDDEEEEEEEERRAEPPAASPPGAGRASLPRPRRLGLARAAGGRAPLGPRGLGGPARPLVGAFGSPVLMTRSADGLENLLASLSAPGPASPPLPEAAESPAHAPASPSPSPSPAPARAASSSAFASPAAAAPRRDSALLRASQEDARCALTLSVVRSRSELRRQLRNRRRRVARDSTSSRASSSSASSARSSGASAVPSASSGGFAAQPTPARAPRTPRAPPAAAAGTPASVARGGRPSELPRTASGRGRFGWWDEIRHPTLPRPDPRECIRPGQVNIELRVARLFRAMLRDGLSTTPLRDADRARRALRAAAGGGSEAAARASLPLFDDLNVSEQVGDGALPEDPLLTEIANNVYCQKLLMVLPCRANRGSGPDGAAEAAAAARGSVPGPHSCGDDEDEVNLLTMGASVDASASAAFPPAALGLSGAIAAAAASRGHGDDAAAGSSEPESAPAAAGAAALKASVDLGASSLRSIGDASRRTVDFATEGEHGDDDEAEEDDDAAPGPAAAAGRGGRCSECPSELDADYAARRAAAFAPPTPLPLGLSHRHQRGRRRGGGGGGGAAEHGGGGLARRALRGRGLLALHLLGGLLGGRLLRRLRRRLGEERDTLGSLPATPPPPPRRPRRASRTRTRSGAPPWRGPPPPPPPRPPAAPAPAPEPELAAPAAEAEDEDTGDALPRPVMRGSVPTYPMLRDGGRTVRLAIAPRGAGPNAPVTNRVAAMAASIRERRKGPRAEFDPPEFTEDGRWVLPGCDPAVFSVQYARTSAT
eukprot:tig00020554_g10855.t1